MALSAFNKKPSRICPIRLKPLLKNMIYVGLLLEWLKADKEIAKKTLEDFF